MLFRPVILGVSVVGVTLVGGIAVLLPHAKASPGPSPKPVPSAVAPVVVAAAPVRVTSRKANLKGRVFVLMYHRTGPDEKYMVRSNANFKKDLETFYSMGFRPVTMAEYASNHMNLAPGASPVVFTFDDSQPSQFNFLKDGSVDPHCFVGIWMKFAEKHPDFPVKATFYINANGPWGSKKAAAQKFEMLKKWGSEMAAHTMTHPDLARCSDDKVREEMAEIYFYLEKRGFKARSFALPYGIFPKNRLLMHGVVWKGRTVIYDSNVLAGDAPAYSPMDPKFNRLKIPRIQAFPGVTGVDWWVARVKSGKTKVYVQP